MTVVYFAALVLFLCVALPFAMVAVQIRREWREGRVGDFDQFRKCTSCDWRDQSSTTTRDRHICPKCGSSTSVTVGRWVLEGNGPIRFEERHP
jgi:ribosomal protein L37AE/L43A